MKSLRIIAAVLIVCNLLSILSICASGDKTHDFRQSDWGDSKTEVIKIEGIPKGFDKYEAAQTEYIIYESSIVGKKASLIFYFNDVGLYKARYILNEKYSDVDKYIDDYVSICNALAKKYGEPNSDEERWSSDYKKQLYLNDKTTAFLYGFLSYSTSFGINETTVEMTMCFDNDAAETIINFTSTRIGKTEYDFTADIRLFPWGTEKAVVKSELGKPEFSDNLSDYDAEYIGYNIKFIKSYAYVAYYFGNHGLYEVRYIPKEEHTNKNRYIDYYDMVKSELSKLYGVPISDEEKWTDSTKAWIYENDKQSALNYGFLSYHTEFQVDETTQLIMSMEEIDNNIRTTIKFCSLDNLPDETDYTADF